MLQKLVDQKVLITQADSFMGPALCAAFEGVGAQVIREKGFPASDKEAASLIADAGEVDVLIINLAAPRPDRLVQEVRDSDVTPLFDTMVYPMIRLGAAVLPQMLARQAGKIIVMGSASPLRGFARGSSYAAARGAQLAWVRSAGAEVAGSNVQINAVAQNFIENPVYFSAEYQATEVFRQRLKEVPAGRLGTAEEDCNLVLFLASGACDFITGQVIPLAGGWAT